jgi:mono/diheme cytochrome c family protein
MRFLAFIGFLAIVAAIGAAVFFFGGFYSVAVTAWEPPIVKWALIQVRKASIARYAEATPSSVQFDAAAVTAGARAYATRGCVNCHGGPGVQWAKFSEGLRPDPPDLKDVAKERQSSHLFWVIRNGINMTGMPSFAEAGVPDPEIWQIVAFLKKLPEISEADYKSWTAPPMDVPRPPGDIPAPVPPAPMPNPRAPDVTPPAPDAAPKPPN